MANDLTNRNAPFTAVLRWLYCLLVALMPFYWCAPAVPMETPNFPLSFLEALLTTIMPLPLFSAIAGILLAATFLLHRRRPQFGPAACIPLLACLPLVAGLSGLINTTEWSYAGNWMLHFGSIACLSAGIWRASREDDKLLPWLFNVIAITGAISALHGWTQHFGGLQSNYEMQVENARQTGVPLSEQFLQKLQQMRSYGSFSDPNVYAAHLLLTGPFTLLWLHRVASRCEASQRRAAQALLLSLGGILLAGAIYFSGSRGALIGAVAGLALMTWQLWLKQLSWKKLLPLAAVCVIAVIGAVMLLSLRTNRRLETASVRVEYYSCAWKTFCLHPLFGAGLGEYFNWHMRLKDWNADDSRDPHSFFFAQLSQCGLPGAADALMRLALPLALALGYFRRWKHKDRAQAATIASAWSAWTLHALLQFNDLITSTTAIAAFCGLFIVDDAPQAPSDIRSGNDAKVARRPAPLAFVAVAIGAILSIYSFSELPKWKRLQELDNMMHDRYSSVKSTTLALQEAVRKYRVSLQPVRMLCDFTTANPEMQNAGIEAAREFTRRAPHRSAAHVRLANFAIRFGDSQLAEEALQNAELWYPNSPANLLTRGILALRDATPLEQTTLSLWSTGHGKIDETIREIVVIPLPTPRDYVTKSLYLHQIERLNALKLPSPDGNGQPVLFTWNQPEE